MSIDKATTPHTNLVFIDVLRSIAVIGVVAVHTAQWTLSSVKDADGWFAAVSTLLYSGRLGVEVFFFLSGFLLTLLYENKAKSLRSYAASRFFRIWPLWTLFSIVWASYFIISGEATDWVAAGFLLSLFFGLWLSPEHYNSFIGGGLVYSNRDRRVHYFLVPERAKSPNNRLSGNPHKPHRDFCIRYRRLG